MNGRADLLLPTSDFRNRISDNSQLTYIHLTGTVTICYTNYHKEMGKAVYCPVINRWGAEDKKMKEVITSRILRAIPLLIAVCLAGFPAQAQYGGGSGEPNDPYLIYTAEQMNEIGLHEEDWDKHFKLMADIDLSAYTGTDFNIIGIDWDNDGSDGWVDEVEWVTTP